MKTFQMILVLVPMFVGMGCMHSSDVQRNGVGFSSHIVDQQLPNGSSVHIERTESKFPLGGGYGIGGFGGAIGNGVYVLPNLTNEIISPNGLTAMEQIPGGTIHVVGVPVPIVQPQPNAPTQADDVSQDIAVLAEGQDRQQEDLDEIKRKLGISKPGASKKTQKK